MNEQILTFLSNTLNGEYEKFQSYIKMLGLPEKPMEPVPASGCGTFEQLSNHYINNCNALQAKNQLLNRFVTLRHLTELNASSEHLLKFLKNNPECLNVEYLLNEKWFILVELLLKAEKVTGKAIISGKAFPALLKSKKTFLIEPFMETKRDCFRWRDEICAALKESDAPLSLMNEVNNYADIIC